MFLHFTESPESKCIVGSTSSDVTFLAKFLPLLTSLFNELRTLLNVNVSGYIFWTPYIDLSAEIDVSCSYDRLISLHLGQTLTYVQIQLQSFVHKYFTFIYLCLACTLSCCPEIRTWILS